MSLGATEIGTRLRRIRQQQQLSLADVQERSDGRWKAVVVGAYERGDRAVTITRLAELADFYGVPLVDLLPQPRSVRDERTAEPGRVTLDLTRLARAVSQEAEAVARFADQVRRHRGDHNGRVLTLRGGDLETIALAVGQEPGAVRAALQRDGVLTKT
jgi:transcriptional regulator with XRE-family HTH domain